MAVSPSTDSSSTKPLMSISAKSPSVSGASLSARSAKRSRSWSICCVDVLVADVGLLDLDAQVVVALDGDDGAHLDDGVELDVALFLAGGDVDLRRRDHVDVFGDDGLGVVLGERVAQRLVTRHLGAETGFEQAAGRLAGTEARHLHFLRQLAERGVDRPLEVFRRDGDVEADLVVVERFDRGGERHGAAQSIGWPARFGHPDRRPGAVSGLVSDDAQIPSLRKSQLATLVGVTFSHA